MKPLFWIGAIGLVLAGVPAQAAVCAVSGGSIAFGNLLAFDHSAALNGSGDFSVTCTASVPYSLALDNGFGPSIGARVMTVLGSGATIRYQLYQDAGHSTVFGDGTSGPSRDGVGTGVLQSIEVYGQIPTQNISAAGAYSDSINVTAVF
jgi:spore coat protein U-like protein